MNELKLSYQIYAYRAAVVELKALLAACPRPDVTIALLAYQHVIVTDEKTELIGLKTLFELNDPIRDYPLIIKTIDMVLVSFSNDAWIRMFRARALWATGHYACALEDLEKAKRMEPKNAIALAMIAETYVQMEKYIDAMTVFEHANEIDPHLPRVYLSRGLAYSFWAHTSTCVKDKKTYYEYALVDLSCAFHLLPDKRLFIRTTTNRILHALKDL